MSTLLTVSACSKPLEPADMQLCWLVLMAMSHEKCQWLHLYADVCEHLVYATC
jgi:hypothetical protein